MAYLRNAMTVPALRNRGVYLSPRWPRAETRMKPESILLETELHRMSLLPELFQPKCTSQGKAQFNGLQGKCLESQ